MTSITIHAPQPVATWRLDRLVIGAYVLLIVVALLASAGGILRVAFPLLSLLVAVWLYWRAPVTYVAFVWWQWLLAPLLARLVDYQSGFDETRLMIAAPYLATLVSGATLWRNLHQLTQPTGWPFLLALAGMTFGLGIGVLLNEPRAIAAPWLEWFTPVLFAFHLCAQPERYAAFKQITLRVFLWGVLLTGLYGIVQYLVAPAWDAYWLTQTFITSFGSPEPLGIRVWSTMNAPGPYSITLMAGLILLKGYQSRWRLPALIAGYLALLLTLARTAWGAWAVSLFFLLAPQPARAKARVLAACSLLALVVTPLALSEPFAELLGTRFQTFNNLADDGSLNERLAIYERGFIAVLAQPLGEGLGRIVNDDIIDSALLDLFLTLGWPGAALYLAGLALLLGQLASARPATGDAFHTATRAISFGITPTLLMASQMIEATGVVYWSCMALALAGTLAARNAIQPDAVDSHPFHFVGFSYG